MGWSFQSSEWENAIELPLLWLVVHGQECPARGPHRGSVSRLLQGTIPLSHTLWFIHLVIPQILLLMGYLSASFSLQEKMGASLLPPYTSPPTCAHQSAWDIHSSLWATASPCGLMVPGLRGRDWLVSPPPSLALPRVSHGAWWWVLHYLLDRKFPVCFIQSLNGHAVINCIPALRSTTSD